MNLATSLSICLAIMASVTGCTTGRAQRTMPVAAPGEYVFQFDHPVAGQAVATTWSQAVARSLTDGTGQARTDEAAVQMACTQRLLATSGPVITKTEVDCKVTSTTATDDGAPGFLTGAWSPGGGLAIEQSNLTWSQKTEARRALLSLPALALQDAFGGRWVPGAQRALASLSLWQALVPEVHAGPGQVTQGTLTFVGLVQALATFSFTGELRYDELNVQLKGTIVLDAARGWPVKVTLHAESVQDMARVTYQLEKSVAIQP